MPDDCLLPAWEDLQNTYDGKKCPEFPLWQNSPVETQIGLGAPGYLSVLGHEDCLDTYSPAPGRTEKCMPKSRPDICIPPAWDKLQEVFDGEVCPDFPLWQNGAPPIKKTPVGLGAPAYLAVVGHEECLSTFSPAPGRTEKCIPKEKPDSCFPPAWELLKELFDGETCPDFPLWQNSPGRRPIQPDPIRGDCLSTFSPAPGETEEGGR